jgi:hypothetical protein
MIAPTPSFAELFLAEMQNSPRLKANFRGGHGKAIYDDDDAAIGRVYLH